MASLINLSEYLQKYPNKHPEIIQQYGTAGFRNRAENLFYVTFRTGILATFRSRMVKGVVGVMVTASHNPEHDNGLKIIEPDGSMLIQSWEKLATEIANIPDDELEQYIRNLLQRFQINLDDKCQIHLAIDTRASSPLLRQALIDGIKVARGDYIDHGLLTTPQLHYIVRCVNDPESSYGLPTEDGYYSKLCKAFVELTKNSERTLNLVIDCANGVGALKMQLLAPYLKNRITFELKNIGDGILNYKCGADYVKVHQTQPESIDLEFNQHYCSFDGDADRLVYYYRNKQDNRFHLLDGDKIAVLMARFIVEILKQSGLSDTEMVLVQTAYANGNSTKYVREKLEMKIDCVPTGVKHLHHRAKQSDIGIYFEANGHGTIIFSDEIYKKISECPNESNRKLLCLIDLINQTVGDAISDMLVVEAILENLNLTMDEWDSFYTDLPNKLLKVAVKDRSIITTTDAERRCLSPANLQNAIDKAVKEVDPINGRSFIRPSGTEDIVRIYAEASTEEQANRLANLVGNLVYDHADGIGQRF
ncbi:phosphoacetylglucosamine mutase-like protein [Sarcoptes scabiei]|uniref:Phosphoacetylglucosamine mutase n=1 Tax=Sarcoptes scabiei TaxID=52283 RepID=A0A131ZT72_SARSC|nr:phosphoacetylglucosamine mutase-like protein [Sarcoptes scabiei]